MRHIVTFHIILNAHLSPTLGQGDDINKHPITI